MGKKAKLGKFRKDKFYKLAKETGFRSRAAFKLIQLNRKFGFLQQSQVCIDLCAAPGGWMQVAKQNMPVSSIVIGVDLYPIRAIPGCIGLVEDITTDKCKQSLSKELQTWKADVVLHDGAPNVGKNWLYDAYQQICLTLSALKLATHFLRKGGWFVTKVFRSKDYNALLWVLKQLFKKVHATKPSASRKESAEIFVVCQSYIAPDKIDPKLLDSKYVFEELELDPKKQSTLLHPDKQKRVKAEGYTEKDISLRNDLSVTEFMQAPNALAALQGVGSIVIDHDGVKHHPKTTNEILECCKDIKVLGRKDIKNLLNWWKHVKGDLFKPPEIKKEDVKEDKKELTQEEIEEKEFEELEKQIGELKDEERREAKRKRKKMLKEKAKIVEKINLNMVIKGDEGPTEQFEEEMFDLKEIKTQKELDDMQDVEPDFVEENEVKKVHRPKYIRIDKDSKPLDDDGHYEDAGESAPEESDTESESNYDEEGLGLSDNDETQSESKRKSQKKEKQEEHPLIKSGDYRDKDTRRKHRVQLWFEKENLQNVDTEDDEDFDLDKLADEYKSRGIEILGEKNKNEEPLNAVQNKTLKRKHSIDSDDMSLSSSSDDDSDTSEEEYNVDKELKTGDSAGKLNEKKTKKIRLTEKELALGAMMVKGRKTKRDLIDAAWNRYTFNDENLPTWFVQDEEMHMRKDIPVPKDLVDEYETKVRELNVRPIKKVMEAKARKKKRALKRLAKAKKQAERILENPDCSSQEKMRQLKKIYKKAEDKKKEVTYVVSKKHLTGKRVRRPAGVKGRYKIVDPRMKKDKRATAAKEKKNKGKGRKK